MNIPIPTIEKTAWGAGPWLTEPDRAEWEHAGLPCLAIRHPEHGNWCGYAAVPPGHPLHGQSHDAADVEVHGGLTYASPCRGLICHVPKPGEPDDVYWFGFDCGHCFDFMPGMDALLRRIGVPHKVNEPPYDHAAAVASNNWMVEQYRTLEYVRAETNRLAEQLAALAKSDR